MNMQLFPYKEANSKCWVFDDPSTKLKGEAFVCGMTEMIDRIIQAKGMKGADNGFTMTFGIEPFEGHDVKLYWIKDGEITFKTKDDKEVNILMGNWYGGKVAGKTMVGWLCPALLKYFPEPPKVLYVGASALPEGLDPIWHDAPDKALAYVEDDFGTDKWWMDELLLK